MNHSRVAAISAALLLPFVIAACAKQQAQPVPIRPVLTHRVSIAAATNDASYSGEVRARYETDVGFRIGGKLVSRHVDVGTLVKQGTLLAKLDPADARLGAESARAQVAAAETELGYAKSEHDRYQTLFQQNFVGQSAYDAKLNALKSAQARLEQARSQYAMSKNQSAYTALVADHEGVITAVNAEAGQVVSAGQPVVRLARLDEKEVAISVPESRLGEVRTGETTAVTLWAAPGKSLRGSIREIAPNADAATRTFSVRVSLPEAGPEVKLGMTANVEFGAAGGRVAMLPLGAIYSQDGAPRVWVVDPKSSKVTLRAVKVGAYREDSVSVLSGLAEGELVVAAGVHRLTEGQSVRLPEQPLRADRS
jgi:membrane fusion protein, multidrug efflux system